MLQSADPGVLPWWPLAVPVGRSPVPVSQSPRMAGMPVPGVRATYTSGACGSSGSGVCPGLLRGVRRTSSRTLWRMRTDSSVSTKLSGMSGGLARGPGGLHRARSPSRREESVLDRARPPTGLQDDLVGVQGFGTEGLAGAYPEEGGVGPVGVTDEDSPRPV